MKEYIMPPDYDAEKSEYAGQDRVYKNRQIIKTISGGKVIIMDYLRTRVFML